ncbi:hypothetical protein AB1Y20_003930 [Prymnesium parvum]|uniref:Glycerophosphocholine acyltransferase 1 n=1 Tax=Prymnesium parvum TaxID=97485 RepID=A0AB34J8P3_PRYPA
MAEAMAAAMADGSDEPRLPALASPLLPHHSPRASRSRSQDVAQVALESIHTQKRQLKGAGLSRASFFAGVANVVLTAFAVGRFPQHYWLVHTGLASLLLPVHTCLTCRRGQRLLLLELCWVTNYLVLGCLGFLVVSLVLPGVELASGETVRAGWYLFFMLAAGPLGASVAATGNALIFHSFENTASLFIHVSPLLTAWCVHVNLDDFRAAYPELLEGIELHTPEPLTDMLLPAFRFYFMWLLPYSAWLLLVVSHAARHGSGAAAYLQCEPLIMEWLPCTGTRPRLAALCYLAAHLVGVSLSFVLALLAFYSLPFFHCYVVAMVLSAVWQEGAPAVEGSACTSGVGTPSLDDASHAFRFWCQGSSRYNYYLLEVYEKKVVTALERRGEGNIGKTNNNP